MSDAAAIKQHVLNQAKEQKVRFVHLQFTDILGILKSVAIPVEQLESALDGNIMFDGSSIEGFVRIEESDMYLQPDPTTFAVFPWIKSDGPRVARLICDVHNPDGTPFSGDPRSTLKRAVAEAHALGYTFEVGPEPEFFLFPLDQKGEPILEGMDRASYFDQNPNDHAEGVRRDIVLALEEMGFEIEAAHHEVAAGQHEIDFKYNNALATADNIMTFRFVVRTIASQRGYHASFMPKPIFGQSGSGMHLHQSFSKDGRNVFADSSASDGLSSLAKAYIAGLLEHAREYTAITNPLVNSYKRLVPGYEAPIYIAWSTRNRSPLIRIPASSPDGVRLELRSPDPACNPYLALAVTLKAGLDGVNRHLRPPAPVNRNIYRMSVIDRDDLGIGSLPTSLEEALFYFRDSKLMRQALGDHIFFHFLSAKQIETDIYRQQVHPWELEQYLHVF